MIQDGNGLAGGCPDRVYRRWIAECLRKNTRRSEGRMRRVTGPVTLKKNSSVEIIQKYLMFSGVSNLFRDATGEEPSGSSTSSKNSDEFFSSSWF
jgi:hypothetical protein